MEGYDINEGRVEIKVEERKEQYQRQYLKGMALENGKGSLVLAVNVKLRQKRVAREVLEGIRAIKYKQRITM